MVLIDKIKEWFDGNQPSSFVKIPFSLAKTESDAAVKIKYKGHLYVSPMPFGPYDPYNTIFKEYISHKIKYVMMLVTDAEILNKNKKKMKIINFYEKNGLTVLRLPFQDLSAPPYKKLAEAVPKMIKILENGNNLVTHCNAGVGRTGIVTACIVSHVLGLDGVESIEYIKNHMMINLTSEQKNIIIKWAKEFQKD